MFGVNVSVGWYMMHFSFRGRFALNLQLHNGMVLFELILFFSTILLCLEIRFAMSDMQL